MLQLHLQRGYQNLAVCECIMNFGYLCTSDTGAWSILFPAMDCTEDKLPTIVCAVYCYEISSRNCKVTCIVLIASAYFWSYMIFLVMFFFYCHSKCLWDFIFIHFYNLHVPSSFVTILSSEIFFCKFFLIVSTFILSVLILPPPYFLKILFQMLLIYLCPSGSCLCYHSICQYGHVINTSFSVLKFLVMPQEYYRLEVKQKMWKQVTLCICALSSLDKANLKFLYMWMTPMGEDDIYIPSGSRLSTDRTDSDCYVPGSDIFTFVC